MLFLILFCHKQAPASAGLTFYPRALDFSIFDTFELNKLWCGYVLGDEGIYSDNDDDLFRYATMFHSSVFFYRCSVRGTEKADGRLWYQ